MGRAKVVYTEKGAFWVRNWALGSWPSALGPRLLAFRTRHSALGSQLLAGAQYEVVPSA